MANYETLDYLKRKYQVARDNMSENSKKQQRDVDYYHGKQLDDQVRENLIKRGQQPITLNFVDQAIDGMLGVVSSSATQPRGYPRTPQAENAADVTTKILQYLADTSQLNEKKINVAFDTLTYGVGAGIVEARLKKNRRKGTEEVHICFEQVRAEEFFYDPYSRRHDFKDARYLGIAKWMDIDVVQNMFPGRDISSFDATNNDDGGVFEDRPDNMVWVEAKRKRLLIIDMYHLEISSEGDEVWMHSIFCGNDVLEQGESGYLDDYGNTLCPIIATSCRVDRENNRYGLVRMMVDAQNEINSRRSKLLQLVNTSQTQKQDPNAMPVDKKIVRAEAARPDGVIPDGYVRVPTNDMASGQSILLADTVDFINRRAPTPAVLGRTSESISGRAKLVDAQAGLTEYAVTLNRLATFEKDVYKHLWFAATQFWTDHKIISITGDPESPEFLEINVPIMEPRLAPVMGPDGQPQIDPMTGTLMTQVQNVPVGFDNHISELDMDVEIEVTPESPNLQTEVWESILGLMQAGMTLDNPAFDLAIEFAPLQDKARIKNRLQTFRDQQQQQNAQAQQQQQAMAEQMAGIQAGKTQSETAKNVTQARLNEANAAEKEASTMNQQLANDFMGGLLDLGL